MKKIILLTFPIFLLPSICHAAFLDNLPNGQAVYSVNSFGCGPLNGQVRQDFLQKNNLDIKTPTFVCDPVPAPMATSAPIIIHLDQTTAPPVTYTQQIIATKTETVTTPIFHPVQKIVATTTIIAPYEAYSADPTTVQIIDLDKRVKDLEDEQNHLIRILLLNSISIILLGVFKKSI